MFRNTIFSVFEKFISEKSTGREWFLMRSLEISFLIRSRRTRPSSWGRAYCHGNRVFPIQFKILLCYSHRAQFISPFDNLWLATKSTEQKGDLIADENQNYFSLRFCLVPISVRFTSTLRFQKNILFHCYFKRYVLWYR